MSEIDPYGIVEQHWPYDGPYSDEHTSAAATALGRLVRYLNNATQDRAGLPYAATTHRVLSATDAAVYGLAQLARQLRNFTERQADDPTLYDDRRDRPGAQTALELAEALNELLPAVAVLAHRLGRASHIASHLGNEDLPNVPEAAEGDEQAVDRRWWVSWYGAGAFEYRGPWWVTGHSTTTERATICAAVIAPSADAAQRVIVAAHDSPTPVVQWRFIEARGADWSPFGDRFPRAAWMQWPADGPDEQETP